MAAGSINLAGVEHCECAGCDIDQIKNLDVDFRMTPCTMVINACKAIRKLLKKGFVIKKGTPHQRQIVNDGEHFEEYVSRKELIKSLTHTLVLCQPNKTNYIKFILARYRTCVSVHDLYYTTGFYVSDNYSMAFLRFKTNRKLSCYFIDMTTNDVKHTDINIELTDKEQFSMYLFNGTLWIVQNWEIGSVNVSCTRLRDNPVKTLVRNFGSMDYWNPYSTMKVSFTDTELYHEFLHVTTDNKKTKIFRKHVSTLKNAMLIPVGNRQIVVYHDVAAKEIVFEFSVKEEKVKFLKTATINAKFELRSYYSASSDVTNLVVVRINKSEVFLLDSINCRVLKAIPLNDSYDLSRPIHFMFSPNGQRLLVLGPRKHANNEFFWTQHSTCGVRTLKQSAMRMIRQNCTVDELRWLVLPKTLRSELSFGY